MSSEMDLERLRMLSSLGLNRGHDVLAEIVTRFAASTTAEAAREAARNDDLETATLHLHSLKGSASNLGATGLARLAGALERDLRAGAAFEALGARFDELNSAHAEAVLELQRFMSDRTPLG